MKNKIIRHLSRDPIMAGLIERYPYPDEIIPISVYEKLISSIIFQQLSTKVATVIHGRFLDLFENAYPDREKLLSMDLATLRNAGLSRQKANYVQNVAEFFQNEEIDENQWDKMTDDAIIQYLTQIKGVGRWTVQMNLMFNLRRPDVFPVDDLGIQNAIKHLYEVDASTTKELKEKMEKVASPWKPFRTYASWYLWRSTGT